MKRSAPVSKSSSSDAIICYCLQVTEGEILEAVQNRQIQTIKDIVRYTQAGGGCTACHSALESYLGS